MNKGINEREVIVIGTSAGGLSALIKIVGSLPENFPLPLIIVQHRAQGSEDFLEILLQSKSNLPLRQAEEKEKIKRGQIYTAPSSYHLIIERDRTFSLSTGEDNKISRPSIDILFETASEAYKEGLIAIILTGASNDGTNGIISVAEHGGLCIAQEPATAEFSLMPASAIASGSVEKILNLDEIIEFLKSLATEKRSERRDS